MPRHPDKGKKIKQPKPQSTGLGSRPRKLPKRKKK